ncbi:MAG: hypothetical protein WCC03_05680 [Candidatus Acidiferrales bacterium]
MNSNDDMTSNDYDGTKPLDDPADEAVALFFAAPRQFRQFKSASALAEHLGVSRMTIYRRAEDVDVAQRIMWLLRRSMRYADLLACREWPGIVQAQVTAALAGDLRAAMFCQNRAWRQSLDCLGVETIEPAIAGADAITLWQEKTNEQSEAEELEAKENPGTEGEKPSE